MQSLPDDVLYFIFLYALPSIFNRTSTIIEPSNFALVCRRWHNIVLSRPSLWASIKYKHQLPTVQMMKHTCEAIKTWLRRSASSPLKIEVHHEDGRHGLEASGTFVNQLLQLIVHDRHRWEDVNIYISGDFLNSIEPRIVVPSTPPLTTLSLQLRGRFVGTWPTIACVDLSHSVDDEPSTLQELVLGSGTMMRLPSPTKTLYLPYLDTLSFNVQPNSDLADTLRILGACPALTWLSLGDRPVLPPRPFPFRDPIVPLPNLMHLSLESYSPETTQRLLSSLTCPDIRSFSLYSSCTARNFGIIGGGAGGGGGAANAPIFISMAQVLRFFQRVHPAHLVSLNLRCDSYSSVPLEPDSNSALEELLILLSDSLECLILSGPIVDNILIDILTDRAATDEGHDGSPAANQATGLCSSLFEINLSRTSLSEEPFGIQKDAAEEMVLSRWKSGEGALREVVLILPWFSTFVEERPRMKECVEEGLEISCARN